MHFNLSKVINIVLHKLVQDNGNQEACQSGKGRGVAHGGEPVHIQWKNSNWEGHRGVMCLPGKKKGGPQNFSEKKMKNTPTLPPN